MAEDPGDIEVIHRADQWEWLHPTRHGATLPLQEYQLPNYELARADLAKDIGALDGYRPREFDGAQVQRRRRTFPPIF